MCVCMRVKMAPDCQAPHLDQRGMFEKTSGRRFFEMRVGCRGSPAVSAMDRSPLTGSRKRSPAPTVNCCGEVDNRSPLRTWMIIAIQWPYTTDDLFHICTCCANAWPSLCWGWARVLFRRATKSSPELTKGFLRTQVGGSDDICCTQTHN